jgi:uncharacterized protein YajQ (UPF0234 family)
MASKAASMDIVSEIDLSEVKNAVNQSMQEIHQRFDFKNSKSEITLDEKENNITILSDDEYKLKSVTDVLQGKLIKRKIPLEGLSYGTVEDATGGTVRQVVSIQQGIPQDKGKEIVKYIKTLGIKVQAQIMDDQVRVTGKKRDDLQEVIAQLKEKDFGVAMNFTNYR